MIVFGENARRSMIPIVEKEDEQIDKLQQEYNELQVKLKALEERCDACYERRGAVVEAYGIARDYVNKCYILDPDYTKQEGSD